MADKGKVIRSLLLASVIALAAFAGGYMLRANTQAQNAEQEKRARLIEELKERLKREFARVEEVEARGYPRIFDPGPEDVPETMFVTNIQGHWRVKEQTVVLPVRQYMVNYANVLYSKEFAERYGYPTSHVAELSEGLHLIEFWMQTEKSVPRCRFHLLIDKSKELWLPTTRFNKITEIGNSHLDAPMVLPARIKGFKESARDQEFRLANRGKIPGGKERDFYLGSALISKRDQSPEGAKETGSFGRVFLETYSPNLYEDLNYLVIRSGCGEGSASVIEQEKSQLWIATDASGSAGRRFSKDSDDYYRVYIPPRMKSEIVPLMRSHTGAVYFQTPKILNRYYNSIEKEGQ